MNCINWGVNCITIDLNCQILISPVLLLIIFSPLLCHLDLNLTYLTSFFPVLNFPIISNKYPTNLTALTILLPFIFSFLFILTLSSFCFQIFFICFSRLVDNRVEVFSSTFGTIGTYIGIDGLAQYLIDPNKYFYNKRKYIRLIMYHWNFNVVRDIFIVSFFY